MRKPSVFWVRRGPRRSSGPLQALFRRRVPAQRGRGQRRRSGVRPDDLAVEALEQRRLLAVVIDRDVIQAGDITYSDGTSITINAGVVLNSTGGKIKLDAPSIRILSDATLRAAGSVELTASKTYPSLPLNIWSQYLSVIEAIAGTTATVDIGAGVEIAGSSFTITATSGDKDVVKEATSIPFVGQFVSTGFQYLNDLSSAPVSVQVKQPTSAITLGSGATITTTGDVSITGAATADATGQAIWSVFADYAVKEGMGWQGTGKKGFGIAAGFSYADATATTRLAESAQINAGGKVTLGTTVKSTGAMSSRVTLNQGLQQTNPNNIEVAYAGAYTKATSRVTVDAGASVVAAKNVAITASATDKTKIKSNTASYRDGLAGVTVGTGFAFGTAEVIVNGSITAGKASVPAALVFNPALTVDFASRSIVFPSAVGFRTGDEMTYSSGFGGAIPGLVSGQNYYAIVDPARPERLRLAASAADAEMGQAIDFGAGYPTLTAAKGVLPIVSVDAAGEDTIEFGFDRWPDGSLLFTDGQAVDYAPAAGQYLGHNDSAGKLIGPLPAGTYTVQVVPPTPETPGMRIRLLDPSGRRVDLNDNPQFVLDDGTIYQVAGFDSEAAIVSFDFPKDAPFPTPDQNPVFVNGQRLRYVQGFGTVVPGLADGGFFHAVVDPATPRVIQLADSEAQARSANPAVQDAVPTLVTTESDPARRRTIPIGDVQPGTGLVFAEDPLLAAGTAVVYREVPGKPVGGLVDGATYYAYPQVNPFFEENFPQYVVGLRAAADTATPLIDETLFQRLSAGGTEFAINGIDAVANALAVALPQAAPASGAGSAGLVGGDVVIVPVPAAAPQVWTNATGGTFTISVPHGLERRVTAAIPFDAAGDTVRQAINALGVAGVNVATVYGRGTYADPWTLLGSGLDDLEFDWANLSPGGSVWSKLTIEGLQAVSTTATGGSFTLTLDVAGTSRTTVLLPFDASAAALQAAIDALPGVLAGVVVGSGTAGDPWLIEPRVQPLRTGDPVVFRDAWGSQSPGLADGQTYYAIVAPLIEQGNTGAVVIRLANTAAEATAAVPAAVRLAPTVEFETPVQSFMSGTGQSFTSTIVATGIALKVTLDSSDSQSIKSANGSEPKLKDLLTRGDFALTSKGSNWSGVMGNILSWKDNGLKDKNSSLALQIQDKLGGQQANEFVTVSASGAGLRVDNTAQVIVGPTAVLKTPGTVSITSQVTEPLKSSVESTVSKPNKGALGVAVAVDVVQVWNKSHATIQAGAQVTGGDGVAVDSSIEYPWAGQMTIEKGWWPFFRDNTLSFLASALGGKLGVDDWFFNHWSNAGIKQRGAQDKDRLAVSIAASVSWVGIYNDCLARIEDGAAINQDGSVVAGGSQPVSVTASTGVSQTGFNGTIYLDLSPDNIAKMLRRGDAWYDQLVVLQQGGVALGGSVGYLEMQNTTRAVVGDLETGIDGRPLRTPTRPLRMTFGDGGLEVDAVTEALIVQLAQGGAAAQNFGFSGTAAYLDAHFRSQVTEAAVTGPADASRRAVIDARPGTVGKVDVHATDTTFLIPVAGAVLISDSKGLGVSTAIARLDRGVTARIGSRDDDSAAGTAVLDLTAAGDVAIGAEADGGVTPSALAAAVISPAKPAGVQENLEQPVAGAGNQPKGAWGLAVSGDFTMATVRDDVRAGVHTLGRIVSTAPTAGGMVVAAKNTTLIQGTAGAASFLKGSGSSTSLAGAVTIIDASSTVVAAVRRATVDRFGLDVRAENARRIGNLAASGTGAVASRSGTFTLEIAGSVTLNTITATTRATIDRVAGTALGAVAVTAQTADTIWSAAGSFLFNFSPTGGGQAPGKSLGVGEAFARNDVTSTTEATVVDSSLTLAAGGVQLSAADTARLYTFAAGVIVVDAGSALGGMFSFVNAHSTTTAAIDGGTLSVGEGTVEVLATSALLLVTGAGDLIIGRGQGSYVAVGAAVASVGGTIGSTARVGRGASVRVRKGGLSVASRTRNPEDDPAIAVILANVYTPHREQNAIWSFAIGVVWAQSTVTADFSVSVNTLALERRATIEDSATATIDEGTLAVRATDEAGIYSGAGAIAVGTGASGKVAAGAAVVRNSLSGATTARISSSTVTTGGGGTVDVAATAAGLIGTAAVGGEVAGQAALGTALVFNDIVQAVDARITGAGNSRSNVTAAGAVSVAATERSRIGAGAGQVSVATEGVGAGAAAAVNGIDSTVTAAIEQATVSSQAAVTVAADAAGEIYSYAMGVAGAFSGEIFQFAGVGSGTGNTLVRRVTAAVRSQAVVESRGLAVTATEAATINTAAGTVAIQYSSSPDISVAVGVSASTNTIGSATDATKRSFVEAIVSDSTVIAHGAAEVAAVAKPAIQAITAAGAGQFSGSGGPFIGLAGAGAGSGNTIQMDVTAGLQKATVNQDAAGGISVTADSQTSIYALAGGVAVAGSSAKQSKGIGVTLGAAASVNTVSIATQALVEGQTSITSPGKLTVAATGAGSIKAVSFGVAGALRAGGSTFDLTGAGTAAINTVTTATLAVIRSTAGGSPTIGSAGSPLGSVVVTARDTSSIVAGAGGLSSIISFGKGSAVGLSVGVSYTINEVGGTVSAGIEGGSVHASGDLTISADYAKGQNATNVYSVTVAGAFDASAGSGVLFPLAGSGSRNTVAIAATATISNAATVQVGGVLSVSASDTSAVSSNAGGVGIGLKFGDQAGAVAVGAAYGKNEIRNTVRARIEQATVTGGQGVAVAATAAPAIESVAYGVAVSVAVAGDAVSAAGSGASAYNTVGSTVAADVRSATVTATTANLTVKALDQPQITTRAGAGSLAVAIGDGVAIAPGVVVIESTVADTVTALIGRADGSGVDSKVKAAAGTVGVEATSAANLSSLGVAVAASVAISPYTGAFSGAGARGTVTLGSTITAAIDAASVEAGAVSVAAVDRDTVTKNTIGTGALAVGVVGGSIGVSLTETTAANSVEARIGAGAVVTSSGGITVDVRGGNTLATESVATSVAVTLGGSGAGGHAFTTDTSSYQATVATGAKLTAAGTLVVQARGSSDDALQPDGRLDAQAHGGAGGIVAVGVALARATDGTTRRATIGDTVDLSGVARLDVLATSSPNVTAGSIAVDVGAVAVTVNESTVRTSGEALASTGRDVTLPGGDVRIMAAGSSRLDASQTGVAAGSALAAGATLSIGESGLATSAVLGAGTKTAAGRSGGLIVRANSRDVGSRIQAVSGSGGLFAGFGTKGELVDKTTTRASILGGTINAGTVDLGSDRANRYDLDVSSYNITIAAGVGVTRASFTADQKASDGLDRVRVAVGADTIVNATGQVTVGATHGITRLSDRPSVKGVGGSVLVAGQQAISEATAQVPAVIDVGDRAAITSGSNALTQPGGITILPAASLEIRDSAELNNIGLLVSGGRMASYLTGGVMPQVRMGNDVRLVSHGQLNVGTTAFVAAASATNGWGYALFGGIGTYATSDVTVDQRVTIGDRARFASDGSMSVTPGDDATASSSTMLSADATARASSTGIVGIPVARARTKLTHTSSLSFGTGADVSSGGNLYLSARAIEPIVTATGEADGDIIGIPTTDIDQLAEGPSSSSVTLAGTFLAGRENKLEIVIPNDNSGGFTSTVRATPASLYGVPVSAAWQYLPAFSPLGYIDSAGFSPEVATALRAGVAQGTVGAISFAAGAPLMVSGGSVTVTGDSISAAAATLTGRTASISIKNESPDYVVLGRTTIANIEGGRVDFRNAAGTTVADPQGARVNRDPTSTPTITVELTYPSGVGGSTFGPALFLAGAMENLGGDVTIRNAAGSFGQSATIAAKRITIETPNGVFAVDTPQDPWNAAGTPAAQLWDKILWPGGDPRHGRPNANQAVMYAINAMNSPYSAGWKGAVNEDQLNGWVYGDPRENRVTYVFFGGSVPQYSNQSGNTQGTNENWARTARPDGNGWAWKMTDKTPPLGKGEGWDHAWMPKLQVLPDTVTTPTLPSQAAATAVRGQVIVINAKVANINGTLEAGGDKPASQSVVVPQSLEGVLLDYQRRYRLGEVTAPIYRIPDAMLHKRSASDRLIGASFDARTGQIILDQATSSGAGSVSIRGKIINTDLAGKIKVRGGSGDLDVQNDTPLPLVTSNLRTNRAAKQAVVSITDLNVGDASQQQTAYVYDGAQILVYRGAAGVDLTARTDVRDRVPGSTTAFNPQPNARWQWQMDASASRSVNTNLPWSGNDWPGVTVTPWAFANPDAPWQTRGGAAGGDVVFETNNSALVQRITADGPGTWDNFRVPYQDFYPGKLWDTGFSANHPFQYPSFVSMTMTMSLKADWPIGIDFVGTSFGRVTVQSSGDVVVAGGTVAADVSITSTRGGILAAGGGFVEASSLHLGAVTGIGSGSSPLLISDAVIDAATTAGGVFLDGRTSDPTVPTLLRGLSAPAGTVAVTSAGDLLRGAGTITAASVALVSGTGRIGTLSAPILVHAGPGGTLQLQASAVGDIHVRQDAGDMLVGTVTSSQGDVQLAADGNIVNADTWTIDPEAAAERLRALTALGATDSDAYLGDVTAFEGNVTSRYRLLWSVRTDGDELSLWRLRTSEKLGVPDPTDVQIREYVAALNVELDVFFTTTIGPDWPSLPQFQEFDPAYVYQATPAQVEGFRQNRTVSEARLSLQLRARALDNPPPGESVEGRVNVTGTAVQLASARGSVGLNDSPVTITADEFATGYLTPNQRQELALAANPGDAKLLADGGVVLNVRRPIILAARGRVDVDGPGGVAIAQKAGDLRIGNVGSRDGLVSVIADGSILNAVDSAIAMWGTPIGFERPSDWNLVGDAGQSLTSQAGLYVPGFKNTKSGTWFKNQVGTGSFRVSFTYQATAQSNPGDGLAFVLQTNGPTALGTGGGGLGYAGIPEAKVGFLINVYAPNGAGTFFDKSGTWNGGSFTSPGFSLTGQPVYVTLVYDAVAKTMLTTLGDRPAGEGGQTWSKTYADVDLAGVLGSSAFMGFTTGTGSSVTSQQITQFSFATGSSIAGQLVAFPASGQSPWVTTTSDSGRGGFAFANSAPPTLTFPNLTNLAASAWYPTPVRVSSDFRVTFRYRYSGDGSLADGMALVFQNSSEGLAARGTIGGGLGYSGIPGQKVGYLINIWNGATVGTRFDTLGSTGSYNAVSWLSKDAWISVELAYDATAKTLTETLKNESGTQTYTKTNRDVNLPQLLGSPTATLGVTAASGGSSAKQEIQSLEFSSPPVPEPSGGAARVDWELNGSVQWLANGVLTIPAIRNTATSTWYGRPVTTGGFEVNFTYQATNVGQGLADGMAFVLQRSPAGFTATGASGGSLGYNGIPGPKVGFLMNLYGTAGVRFDTGSESGAFQPVSWLAGGPVAVRLVYNAEAKTLTATLSRTGQTPFVFTWTGVDLAATLGGSQAIMGITSGTGGEAAQQVISNFVFYDRTGIESFRPVVGVAPTVRLWSTYGNIGAKEDMIAVKGRLQADAPRGSVFTNPPPPPNLSLARFGGRRPDGTPVTNDHRLSVPPSAPSNQVLFSTDEGRTWQASFRPTEGLNRVQAVQQDARGTRSTPAALQFVLDRRPPAAPRVRVLDRVASTSRTGRLAVSGTEPGATVQYAVNGGGWSAVYAPVTGRNVVAVRQLDLAGNVSKVTSVAFVLKSTVAAPTVALLRDTGSNPTDRVTNDGRLRIGNREAGARIQFSIDGGLSWQASFTARPGRNELLVRQVDRIGNVSDSTSFDFVLRRRRLAAPLVTVPDRVAGRSRTGLLSLSGIAPEASVQYSVNGGRWSSTYAPVTGRNVVAVRQLDLAGNVSRATTVRFTLDQTEAAT